ncbi:hypothetical protein PG989_004671 [Apiospora arundinis]
MADAISAKKKLVIVTIDFGTSKSAQQCVSTESSLEDSITQNEERRVLASATECGDTCSFLPPNGSHTVGEWHELPQVYQHGLHTDIALDVLPVSVIRVAYQSLTSVLQKGSYDQPIASDVSLCWEGTEKFPVHMIDEEDQKHRVITVLLKGWQRIGVVEESDEWTPRSVQQGMVLDGLASSRLRVPVRRAFEILIAQIEKGQNPNEPPDGGKCQIM